VALGEALSVCSLPSSGVRDLQLLSTEFEMDSKIVVDNFYDKKNCLSDFSEIINNGVKFIPGQCGYS